MRPKPFADSFTGENKASDHPAVLLTQSRWFGSDRVKQLMKVGQSDSPVGTEPRAITEV